MFEKVGYVGNKINHHIKSFGEEYSDLWELALEVNYFSNRLQYELIIHNEYLPEMLGATLYVRILTNYQGLLILAFRGMVSQSYVMLRTELEALFSLAAIAKDKNFPNKIVLHEEHERKSLANKIRRYEQGKNSNSEETKIAKEIIKNAEMKIKEYDIEKLSTEKIAHKADLHDLYDTVYAVSSLEVHVSVRTLESYLVIDENKKIVALKNEPDYKGTLTALTSGVECMILANGSLNELFKLEKHRDVESYRNRLGEIKKNNF